MRCIDWFISIVKKNLDKFVVWFDWFRILREVKERRRKWAEKLTPRVKNKNSIQEDTEEIETQEKKGMLPDDIVKLLSANEKYYSFHSSPFIFIYFLTFLHKSAYYFPLQEGFFRLRGREIREKTKKEEIQTFRVTSISPFLQF